MLEQLITIILVAIVLGLDAFSLSLGIGLKGISTKNAIKFAVTIAVYHVLMPLIGLNIGMAAGNLLGIWAARLGAIALSYIGFELLLKGYRETKARAISFTEARHSLETKKAADYKWTNILMLGFLVSIDALTVGFGLGTLRMSVLLTCFIIGTVAGIMTLLGFMGGKVFSRIAGSYAQIIGGIILLALAAKMLFQGGV
ncbi:MAG: manganese efflux pump [Syntrophomonadaceae bacterium]|jgi:putative Mn2+ efflux pump MntP|nr:manganese efflux pump [Syntrophomonadaceae bacterium]